MPQRKNPQRSQTESTSREIGETLKELSKAGYTNVEFPIRKPGTVKATREAYKPKHPRIVSFVNNHLKWCILISAGLLILSLYIGNFMYYKGVKLDPKSLWELYKLLF